MSVSCSWLPFPSQAEWQQLAVTPPPAPFCCACQGSLIHSRAPMSEINSRHPPALVSHPPRPPTQSLMLITSPPCLLCLQGLSRSAAASVLGICQFCFSRRGTGAARPAGEACKWFTPHMSGPQRPHTYPNATLHCPSHVTLHCTAAPTNFPVCMSFRRPISLLLVPPMFTWPAGLACPAIGVPGMLHIACDRVPTTG